MELADLKNKIRATIEHLPAEELMTALDFLEKLLREAPVRKGTKTPTQAFLEKCGGWQDERSAQEIVDEIYAARNASNRGGTLFTEHSK